MPPMEYYKVLNLNQDATNQELRIAFKKLALAYHPDRNPGNKNAESMFKYGSNAYNVLMDPEKRRIYDEYGEEGLKYGWSRQNHSYYGSSSSSSTSSRQSDGNNPSPSSASSSRQSKSTNPSSSSSSSSSSRQSYDNNKSASTSFLHSLHKSYGNVFSFRQSYAKNPSFYKSNTQYEYPRTSTGVPFGEPMKKKDASFVRKLPCSLEQLYTGSVRRMKITRTVIVKGTSKTTEEIKIVAIKIKPGCKAGTKVTFSKMGNEKPDMIPADVVFVIVEKSHTLYSRNGDDLLIKQNITHVESLKGTILKIPTLDGRSLSVKLPSRVTLGYEHKVPDEGMPLSKVSGKKGTLKITITNIRYP